MDQDARRTAIMAAVGAVVLTAAAVTDWVVGGVPTEGTPGAVMQIVHVGGYLLLLPAALALRERYAPTFGRPGRVAAAALIGSLVAMTLGFTGLALVGETALVGALAGVGFLGMFASALVIGIATWRRRVARPSALLLMAPFPVLAILVAAEASGLFPSHPALMEAAAYFGVAALAADRPAPAPLEPAVRSPAA